MLLYMQYKSLYFFSMFEVAVSSDQRQHFFAWSRQEFSVTQGY
jgi:hypothetical protein